MTFSRHFNPPLVKKFGDCERRIASNLCEGMPRELRNDEMTDFSVCFDHRGDQNVGQL
jgi:hypothetical protein